MVSAATFVVLLTKKLKLPSTPTAAVQVISIAAALWLLKNSLIDCTPSGVIAPASTSKAQAMPMLALPMFSEPITRLRMVLVTPGVKDWQCAMALLAMICPISAALPLTGANIAETASVDKDAFTL